MFKQLFGHPTRKRITIAFLNDLLHRSGSDKIIDLHFENSELVKETEYGKENRLDILVMTDGGEKINIEIQLTNKQNIPERFLYYWARLYSSSIGKSESYSNLPPTIMISIHQESLFPTIDRFHTVFRLREESTNLIWSPQLEFHAFDLAKFMVKWKKYRRNLKENPPPELPWLMMLSAADYRDKRVDGEFLQELEEYAMKEQEIREALIEWENLSVSKENKAQYEARRKYLLDMLNDFEYERNMGREEGRAIGRKEGRKEGETAITLEIAQKMILRGMDRTEIRELTGLRDVELDELEKKVPRENDSQ